MKTATTAWCPFEVKEEDAARVRRAARACPERAVHVSEEPRVDLASRRQGCSDLTGLVRRCAVAPFRVAPRSRRPGELNGLHAGSEEAGFRYWTGPVPTLPFYDEEYFRLEREAVFKRVWLHIGRESELERPGQFILRQIEIANVSVLIARGHDEKLRAFYNVCTHRGTELVREQRGETGSFSCRYHNWTFRLDGSLRSVPDADNFFDLD